jgi:hypothetical protein
MPLNRKAGARRLVDMSEPLPAWAPDLPALQPPYEFPVIVSPTTSYVLKFWNDERSRLVEFAVVQRFSDPDTGLPRRVRVYDTCHGKGLHVHIYDDHDQEIEERAIRPIASYDDLESAFQEVMAKVTTDCTA